jgi:hypothetical protein
MNIHSIAGGTISAVLCFTLAASAQDSKQKTFATPEDAVVALVDAGKAADNGALRSLFGAEADKLLVSGDPIMDQRNREVFLVAYSEQAALMAESPTRDILYVGNEDWPFPIPLVKDDNGWRFDTAAGAQEILFRRIGRNELTTIQVCRAYVEAQNEYAATSHDGKPVGAYAQKIASTPGKQDGLFWKSEDPQHLSPLGAFAADAAAQGYKHVQGQPAAFHGYIFRILKMRGGFALIASPAVYGNSGVMSFIVNQDGVVYEKDLGPETATIAAAIAEFKVDASWQQSE